jgi:RNA polymerase sigma-70 factor (ECF subfamily)
MIPPETPAPVGNTPAGDRTLVRYIRGGDDAAANELYRRYAARLLKVVADRCSPAFSARFDPDDIVQSVFRTLYQGVREKFYDAPEDGELWGLLFVLAVNRVRDELAYHGAARRSVHRTTAGGGPDPDALLTRDQTAATLLRLQVDEYLAGLPADEREVVGLRMTGHSVAEIAQKTGRARRTVERILQNARAQLVRVVER